MSAQAIDNKVEISKGEWTLEMTSGMGCLFVCESQEWNDFLSLCKNAIIDCLMKTDYYKSTARSERRQEIEQDMEHICGFPSDFFSFFEAILSDLDDRMQIVGCPEDNPIEHPVFLRHNYGATKKVIQMGPLSVKALVKESTPSLTKTEIKYPVLNIDTPVSCYPSVPSPLDLTKDHKALMERDFEKVESILNSIVVNTRKKILDVDCELTPSDRDKLTKLQKLHFSLQPEWQSYENLVIERPRTN